MCLQAAAAECLIQAVAPAPLECLPILTSPKPAESPAPEKDVSMEFERLRRELKTALEGHGVKKVDAILKGLGGLQDVEQVRDLWFCVSGSGRIGGRGWGEWGEGGGGAKEGKGWGEREVVF